jgi:hypothetical protein
MAGRKKKKFLVAFFDIHNPRNNDVREVAGVAARDEAIGEMIANEIDPDNIEIYEISRKLKITDVKTRYKITVEEDD